MFITFEGPEGSGKTTHANLLTKFLEANGHTVDLTREPGGTPLGEKIRELLLDPSHDSMEPRTELLLYEAARAQHISERIRPALESDNIVICDRFTDASLVYQGQARDIGKQVVKEFNQFATRELQPDLTFIMDISTDEGLDKARQSSQAKWNTESGDRIEQEGDNFHLSVREGYRKLAQENPDRCVLLDLDCSIEELQDKIEARVTERLDNHET